MRIKFHREARSAPDTIDGLKVPYAVGKRNAPKWRWRLILLAVLSPAILLGYSALKSVLTLSANGSVFLNQHEIRAPFSGRVAEVSVRVGGEVRKGDLVLRLEEPLPEAPATRSTRTSETTSSARSRSWLQEELALQERSLRMHEERAAAIEELVRERAATAAELREARLAVDQAQAAVLRARQQIALSASPAESKVVRAEASTTVTRDRLTVRAPEDGRVIDVMTTEGQFVTPGEPLLLLGTQSDPQVIAYVSPEIAPKLAVGSKATIAFPDGTKAQAIVAEQPMLTRRMPADLVDQFGMRPMTVVLHLQAARKWPERQRIHGLPVTVRFHYDWERW